MGNIAKRRQPCISPTCASSDAMQIYEDGGARCFSCERNFSKSQLADFIESGTFEEDRVPASEPTKSNVTAFTLAKLAEIKGFRSRGFRDRLITKSVCEFYGVRVSYDSSGNIDTHYYPYNSENGFKVRETNTKEFYSVGDVTGLFGRELFAAGGKRLIICEGEIDTLSVATASFNHYNKFYPVVGLRSSSSTKDVLAERDWVRSFDEVVIFHDNDEPGEKAKENLITIIGLDKVTTVNFKRNDANEVLTKDGEKALMEIIWDAEVPRPAGLVGKEELWEALVTQNSIVAKEYPDCLDGLNSKLKGMRFAEIALFVSGTGCGKTTLMREIGLHILETSDDMIGICSLEETKAETARKYAAMSLKVNPQEAELSLDELRVGFDNVFGDDRVVVLDHKNSVKDASIVDKLEYMALMGCKYLFVDHITILVSEGTEGLTGNEAIDKIMNDLLRVAQQHNVWIGLVSHLRKTQRGTRNFEAGEMPTLDDIRGSGSIKQVSFDIIGFARDTTSALESENNTVHISVLKGRTVGRTGPTRGAIYDPKTGRYYADPNRPESVGRSDSFSTTATATEVVEYKPTELVKESDIKFVFIPELDDVRALTKMELEQWSETVELSKEDFLSFVNTREPSDKTIEEVKESSNHPDEF